MKNTINKEKFVLILDLITYKMFISNLRDTIEFLI
jgi:hypothetical protein